MKQSSCSTLFPASVLLFILVTLCCLKKKIYIYIFWRGKKRKRKKEKKKKSHDTYIFHSSPLLVLFILLFLKNETTLVAFVLPLDVFLKNEAIFMLFSDFWTCYCYLWWSLRTLYLHACQVRVTVGDTGLCCTSVTYFECN